MRKLHSPNGITYNVQESPDLAGWNPVDPNANLVSGPFDQLDGTDLYTVRGTIPLTNPSGFLRLQIIVP